VISLTSREGRYHGRDRLLQLLRRAGVRCRAETANGESAGGEVAVRADQAAVELTKPPQ
jgi:hypothetical protein